MVLKSIGKYFISLFLMFACMGLFLTPPVQADDAMVLPKGFFRLWVKPIYTSFNERVDPNSDIENLARDYNTDLDRNIFSDLGAMEDGLKDAGFLKSGTILSAGRVDLQIKANVFILGTALEYGLTENLTLGIIAPFIWGKMDVDADIRKGSASVGPNPNKDAMFNGFTGVPIVPLSDSISAPDLFKGIQRGIKYNDGTADVKNKDWDYPENGMVADDVQNLLNALYGYDRFDDWDGGMGIGDIEIGFKYQYYKTDNFRFALQTGVRLPTGKNDDPDNMVDIPYGNGQTDVALYLMNDYVSPWEELWFNFTLRYVVQLPDKQELRVPSDVNKPLTGYKEEVDRKLGDYAELEFEVHYNPIDVVSIEFMNFVYIKARDHIDQKARWVNYQGVDTFVNYQSLRDETDKWSYEVQGSIGFSTLPWVKAEYKKPEGERKFILPIEAAAKYRRIITGKNVDLAHQFILQFKLLFK